MSRGWQSGWPKDWEPGQPPPQVQLWWWGMGPQRPSRDVAPAADPIPVRIGDAERDRAVSDLGDHFAAGRLTREEFDERADQAMQARFNQDLAPLFADLPKPEPEPATPQGGRSAGGPPPWAYAMWLLPVLLVAAVAGAVLLHAPFLIWGLVWVAVILKITGHKRRYRREQLDQRGRFSRPGPR